MSKCLPAAPTESKSGTGSTHRVKLGQGAGVDPVQVAAQGDGVQSGALDGVEGDDRGGRLVANVIEKVGEEAAGDCRTESGQAGRQAGSRWSRQKRACARANSGWVRLRMAVKARRPGARTRQEQGVDWEDEGAALEGDVGAVQGGEAGGRVAQVACGRAGTAGPGGATRSQLSRAAARRSASKTCGLAQLRIHSPTLVLPELVRISIVDGCCAACMKRNRWRRLTAAHPPPPPPPPHGCTAPLQRLR